MNSTQFTSTLLSSPPDGAAADLALPAVEETPPPSTFAFTGSGREYFGIWIVNLVLTIVTLGAYSAWAKVRRTQYFHANTWVAGANFNYLGQPGAILRGRVVALVLLAAYYFAKELSPFLLTAVVLALAVILPWLLKRSLHFRAHNTMHRGLRFRFFGGLAGAYWAFLVWNALSFASAFLFAPAAMQRARRYQFNNASYGTTPFQFTARARQYYRIWARTSLLWLGLLFGFASVFGLVLALTPLRAREVGPVLLAVLALVAFWLTRAHYVAHLQNLIWNHTTLGAHRFASNAQVRPLFFIMLKNALFTVLTLGLYRPFAVVNVARYRLNCLTLIPGAPLSETAAAAGGASSAVGEEAADVFDLEIAL